MSTDTARAVASLGACAALLSACTSRQESGTEPVDTAVAPRPLAGTLKIASPAFAHEGAIPARYTCDGDDVSPPLSWSGAPPGTKSLALIIDDPDAPDPAAPRIIWVHWALYDIPPTSAGLAEGVTSLPEGTREGRNDWGRTGYGGPCPPIGRHRYRHTLHALDVVLPDLGSPTRAELDRALEGHVIDRAVLTGTYQKQGR